MSAYAIVRGENKEARQREKLYTAVNLVRSCGCYLQCSSVMLQSNTPILIDSLLEKHENSN